MFYCQINSQRLFISNFRSFSTAVANEPSSVNKSTQGTHREQNYRKDKPDYKRFNQERTQRREVSTHQGEKEEKYERQERPKREIYSWDEYFDKFSNGKINSHNDVKLPYNFRGMKDFVPINKQNKRTHLNFQKHKISFNLVFSEQKIFYLQCNNPNFLKKKKEFDNMIFAKGENYDEVLSQFDRKMMWFMKALASGKDEELPQCEINFILQAKKAAEQLRRNGYKINFVEDNEGFEKSGLKKGGSPFEISHIMGLSCQRTRNGGTDNYKIIRSLEEKGLIMFISLNVNQDEDGVSDYTMTRDADKQMIMRVHYKYASPYVLQITDAYDKVLTQAPESYIHTAVFENQLRLPPRFSRLDLHFDDWIKLYRIQHEWKLVDFDRYLEGNRLIYSAKEADQLFYVRNEKD